MKKLFLLFGVCSVLLAAAQNKRDAQGRKQGHWNEYNNHVSSKGTYVDNLREGVWTSYTPGEYEYNAAQVDTCTYVHGKKEGYWRSRNVTLDRGYAVYFCLHDTILYADGFAQRRNQHRDTVSGFIPSFRIRTSRNADTIRHTDFFCWTIADSGKIDRIRVFADKQIDTSKANGHSCYLYYDDKQFDYVTARLKNESTEDKLHHKEFYYRGPDAKSGGYSALGEYIPTKTYWNDWGVMHLASGLPDYMSSNWLIIRYEDRAGELTQQEHILRINAQEYIQYDTCYSDTQITTRFCVNRKIPGEEEFTTVRGGGTDFYPDGKLKAFSDFERSADEECEIDAEYSPEGVLLKTMILEDKKIRTLEYRPSGKIKHTTVRPTE